MTDIFPKKKRSEIMASIRSQDTKPECYVREVLWANGYRYARSSYELPGSPDVVLPKYRTVIFVHGCFWHGHDCSRGRLPTTNQKFWRTKIGINKNRDAKIIRKLRRMGWHCFQVWQCRISTDAQRVVSRLRSIKGSRYVPSNA